MFRAAVRSFARHSLRQQVPAAGSHVWANNSLRGFASTSAKLNAKDPNNQKPKSLLNDDIMARAGIDEASTEKARDAAARAHAEGAAESAASASGASSEGSADSSNASSSESSTDSQEPNSKRWENTARKPRDESQVLEKRTRRAWFITGLGILAGLGYLARPLDEDEQKKWPEVPAGWEQITGLWSRTNARLFSTFDTFSAPVFEKLLPDPLPPPYDRPTLVLALDDLLIKSNWTREHGWRVAKRPGVDYFLGYLAQYYEVVIWSDKYQAMAMDTVAKLDPLRAAISYALFREATHFKDGKPVKDLSYLNRDLGRVIVIDVDKSNVQDQPENALILPPWNGNANDVDLVRLIPLLEWIAVHQFKDVRPILKSYAKAPNGDVLAEFERRDAIAREKWSKSRGGSGRGAGSLLGLKGGMMGGDMMPQDVARIENQKSYARFKQHVEENGKKMLEEEEKRMKEVMEDHKMTINKWLTEGGPSQEEVAATLARKEAEAQQAQAPK